MTNLQIAEIIVGSIVAYAITFGACLGIGRRWFEWDKWSDSQFWWIVGALLFAPLMLIIVVTFRICTLPSIPKARIHK